MKEDKLAIIMRLIIIAGWLITQILWNIAVSCDSPGDIGLYVFVNFAWGLLGFMAIGFNIGHIIKYFKYREQHRKTIITDVDLDYIEAMQELEKYLSGAIKE